MQKIRAIGAADTLMAAVYALRHEVFVVEQGVPQELEIDEGDKIATHLVALIGNRVAGTLRILTHGRTAEIGRMAVAAPMRRNGIGTDLMEFAARRVLREGGKQIVLAAQLSACSFYKRLGYLEEGRVFYDANLPHIKMRKRLSVEP
jgi:predicted GNAT family N-acyltransferase